MLRKERIYFPSASSLLEIRDIDVIHKLNDVLRRKKGQSLLIFDGQGKEYEARIKSQQKRKIILEVVRLVRYEPLPKIQIDLAFSLLKSQRADFIIEKATEIGINSFTPFVSSYSQIHSVSLSKLSRWHNIAQEASRQSGRLWIPKVNHALKWQEFLSIFSHYQRCFVFDKRGEEFIKVIKSKPSPRLKNILVVVGPEGGFSPSEVKTFQAQGAEIFNISSFILRAETAAILASGLVKIWLDDAV